MYNPDAVDFNTRVFRYAGETPDEAGLRYREFLSGKIIGLPKGTEKYNTQQLIGMNLVGVYVND